MSTRNLTTVHCRSDNPLYADKREMYMLRMQDNDIDESEIGTRDRMKKNTMTTVQPERKRVKACCVIVRERKRDRSKEIKMC